MTQAETTSPLVPAVVGRFQAEFGDAPRVFFAPGRVNLVGAHLDYNGGFVLPVAVDCGIYTAARLRADDRVCLRSLDDELSVDVPMAEVGASAHPDRGWANYPLGVWHCFSTASGHRTGIEMVFAGDVPKAGGMSSSAALGVGAGLALNALCEGGLSLRELALLAHQAETGYVGLQCGVMDQFASALGRRNHALLLNCSDLSYDHIPIPDGAFEILVLDTKVPRSLAETGFNQRVTECRDAHQVLKAVKERANLAAYQPEDLLAAGSRLAGVLRNRATHVVEEVARVERAVAALRAGDTSSLGEALDQSHHSTRINYDVSCPELDLITDAARERDEVWGARLTGAGFGGCAIALIRPGTAEAVADHVRARFVERFGHEPGFRKLGFGPGATEIVTSGA